MKEFLPLREEAEKRGKLIKAASERHAPPDEACKLIGNFAQAEIKMIKYVESHSREVRDSAADRRAAEERPQGHRERCRRRSARWPSKQQSGPAGPSLSEVLGSAAALPEATAEQEGRQHFRYPERQRPHAMTGAADLNDSRNRALRLQHERRGRPRC